MTEFTKLRNAYEEVYFYNENAPYVPNDLILDAMLHYRKNGPPYPVPNIMNTEFFINRHYASGTFSKEEEEEYEEEQEITRTIVRLFGFEEMIAEYEFIEGKRLKCLFILPKFKDPIKEALNNLKHETH